MPRRHRCCRPGRRTHRSCRWAGRPSRRRSPSHPRPAGRRAAGGPGRPVVFDVSGSHGCTVSAARGDDPGGAAAARRRGARRRSRRSPRRAAGPSWARWNAIVKAGDCVELPPSEKTCSWLATVPPFDEVDRPADRDRDVLGAVRPSRPSVPAAIWRPVWNFQSTVPALGVEGAQVAVAAADEAEAGGRRRHAAALGLRRVELPDPLARGDVDRADRAVVAPARLEVLSRSRRSRARGRCCPQEQLLLLLLGRRLLLQRRRGLRRGVVDVVRLRVCTTPASS